MIALLALLAAADALAAPLPATCTPQVAAGPARHHVLAIDASGSVVRHLEQMKDLLRCYEAMYVRPGDEVSLIAFGMDESASVRELKTLTVPANASIPAFDQVLDDLAVRDPAATTTLFAPLGDFLTQFLKGVRLDPTVVILSDGISDAPATDAPFEAFGIRGMYSAPGIRRWKVAVQGGMGVDLGPLFTRPIPRAGGKAGNRQSKPKPVIDDCLVGPPLVADADPHLELHPTWNPLASDVFGTATFDVRNACDVTRLRSFDVVLVQGDDSWTLGSASNQQIDGNPRTLTYRWSRLRGLPEGEARIELRVHQADGTIRTIFPQTVGPIMITEVTWWGAFGAYLASLGLLVASVGGTATYRGLRRRQKRATAPVLLRVTPGGQPHPLTPGFATPLGAGGLEVPGLESGTVLAAVTWLGSDDQISVAAESGVTMRLANTTTTTATIRLGDTLSFTTANGDTCLVRLERAHARDMRPANASTPTSDLFASFGTASDAGGHVI